MNEDWVRTEEELRREFNRSYEVVVVDRGGEIWPVSQAFLNGEINPEYLEKLPAYSVYTVGDVLEAYASIIKMNEESHG